MSSFHSKYTDKFIEAVLNLNTKDDAYNFFEDICTIKEIQDMSIGLVFMCFYIVFKFTYLYMFFKCIDINIITFVKE